MEEWRYITHCSRRYSVSNLGRVRRNGGVYLGYRRKELVLKPFLNTWGYVIYILKFDLGNKTVRGHRLVAMAFLADYSEELQVNHKDGNKLNNSIDNLEMCTAKQNMQHAVNNGLHKPVRGEKQGASKLTNNDVKELKDLFKTKFYTTDQLGKIYGVNGKTIRMIRLGKTWRHI